MLASLATVCSLAACAEILGFDSLPTPEADAGSGTGATSDGGTRPVLGLYPAACAVSASGTLHTGWSHFTAQASECDGGGEKLNWIASAQTKPDACFLVYDPTLTVNGN